MIKNIIRALRLPFILASTLPFIFGSLIYRKGFDFAAFFLGLAAVAATHLSANLINDYADSKSGADWVDKSFYGLFGGSKLIQQGVFSAQWYLRLALTLAFVSAGCVLALAALLKSIFVFSAYLVIAFFSWQYSMKPLRLAYRYLGELFVFLLFGPALVMGGYFIQSGIFPDNKSLMLSFAPGFLTAAVLFANEVPDCQADKQCGKNTLVVLSGASRAYAVYYLLIAMAFISIAWSVLAGHINPAALLSLALLFPALRSGSVLKAHYGDKSKLLESSRLTVIMQGVNSVILILAAVL